MFKVYFNNKVIIEPGAYTVVDWSKYQNIPITSLFPVILIGVAENGEPWTPYVFNSAIEMKEVFDKDSYFYKVADIVFSPSNEPTRPSPSQVICIKINDSVPGSSGLSTNYTATAKIHTRKSIKVDFDFSNTEYKLTVSDVSGYTESFNVSGNRLSITTGTGDLITSTSGLTATDGTNEEFFDYSIYPTIQELVQAVNNSDVNITITDNKFEPYFPSSGLDTGLSGDNITSLVKELADEVNEKSKLITLSIESQDPQTASGTVYLKGDIGDNIDLGDSAFQEKLFSKLSEQPSGIIVILGDSVLPGSTNALDFGYGISGNNAGSFILALKSWLDSVNSIDGDTPFVVEFGGQADNYDALKQTVKTVNSPYIDVYIQEIKIGDTWYSPVFQAVQVAGLKAGLPLGTSLTSRKVNVVDARFPDQYNLDLNKKSDREKLILDGITYYFFNKKTNNWEVRKGITSYTALDNDGYTDQALVLLGLYLQKDFNTWMAQFIGHDISSSPAPGRLQPIVNENSLKLSAIQKFEQWKSQGYIVNTADKNAYSDVSVSIEGKTARITANLVLVSGVEWIFTTLYAIPYK